MTHELRHHLEWRAREGALEAFDEAAEQNFARMDGEPFDPLFHLSGEAVAEGVYQVDDDFFLDRVVTHILAWEGTDENPAKWYWFEGNFESYEANKVERLGEDAARPHRVTYRKLTRD